MRTVYLCNFDKLVEKGGAEEEKGDRLLFKLGKIYIKNQPVPVYVSRSPELSVTKYSRPCPLSMNAGP